MKNTYTEMKDSGVEWIGDIPQSWKVCKTLRCLAMPITDGPHTTPELFDSGIPFVSAEAVSCGNGHIDFSHIRGFISPEFYEECCKKYVPQKDDIYMIKSGATTGKVAIVDVDRKFTIWSPLAVFRTNAQRMTARYLFYFLQSDAYQKQVELEWSMGTQQNIGMRVLESLLVCLPPLSEQQAIITELDEKCGTIDEIIAEAKASIEEYKMWKSSVIFEAVTKGLDPHAEMKDSGVEWMGDIPKHWKCVPMKYLLQERNQKNDPIVTSERLSLSIDIGVTLYAEKTTNLDRFKEDVSQYKVAYAGDLVLNSMNMIVGAVGIAPVLGCVSPAYYIFYDNSPKHTSARFCDYVFKNKRLRGCLFSLGQGIMAIDRGDGRINTCRLKVSRDDLGRIMLPCPPEDEQEKIITYLDNRFAAIDGIIAEKEALIADMEAYKKSLIFETVTGKRKVC